MLTPDERLSIGLKTIERLRPGFMKRLGQMKEWLSLAATPSVEQPDEPTGLDHASLDSGIVSNLEDNPQAPGNQETPESSDGLPRPDSLQPPLSLQEVIRQVQPLAPGTLILGLCEDGLPFVLDLTNPAPGSILVAGDAGSGKTRLLKALLFSIVLLSPPDQILFNILASKPEEYGGLSLSTNCQHLLAADDSAAGQLLQNLADLLETRRHGKPHGPIQVLVVDDLAACTQWMSEEQITQLYRLTRHGPRSRIWVAAGLSTETIDQVNQQVLAAFRTRLFGSIQSAEIAAYLANQTNPPQFAETGGNTFNVPFGDEWFQFRICDPEPIIEPGSSQLTSRRQEL